jgi:hypothetical protein
MLRKYILEKVQYFKEQNDMIFEGFFKIPDPGGFLDIFLL